LRRDPRARFFKIFRADFQIRASRLVIDEMDSADRDMFRAAIHGDREAFEMIIRTMSRPLFAIAFGILQNREEAEDVVQDAFVKAWKSRWRVREPERLQGWISTIARHRAYDILRRRRTVPLDEQLKEFAAAGNGSESPDDERHRQVRSALATLPELYRSAVALRYLQNMDYATIEQTLGLSNGALRGILGRALASMRKRLKPALAAMI
jgi:RNA polymerase sigma-70 factor (ECF subfamily)